jgi:hypothetical protein
VFFKYGMIGDEVKELRKQLNEASTTRLPRLALDTQFDPLTMARVMEFQHQMGTSTASHGCIHVKPSEAAQLFYWAGQVDLMVIVMKLTR